MPITLNVQEEVTMKVRLVLSLTFRASVVSLTGASPIIPFVTKMRIKREVFVRGGKAVVARVVIFQ